MYLSFYNFLQILLWAGGLILLAYTGIFDNTLLPKTNQYFTIIQSVMLLDVVHVLFRLVPGQVLTTLMQIASRLYVVWLILPQQKEFQIWNYLMFTAWCFAEIIRYSYYINKKSKILLFFRYNAFLILYPIGVLTGECPLIYQHYKSTNFVFDLFVLALYVPCFPYLYFHMLKLRKKNMNKKAQDQKKTN